MQTVKTSARSSIEVDNQELVKLLLQNFQAFEATLHEMKSEMHSLKSEMSFMKTSLISVQTDVNEIKQLMPLAAMNFKQ